MWESNVILIFSSTVRVQNTKNDQEYQLPDHLQDNVLTSIHVVCMENGNLYFRLDFTGNRCPVSHYSQ